MAQDHLASAAKALEVLIDVRRELVVRVASAGHRENIWSEFRNVQATIEALSRALADEEARHGATNSIAEDKKNS